MTQILLALILLASAGISYAQQTGGGGVPGAGGSSTPSGPAGGVLSGTYPNPGFATGGVALPSGSTATTQTGTDNSTLLATDAFVKTAISGFSSTPNWSAILAGTNAQTGAFSTAAPWTYTLAPGASTSVNMFTGAPYAAGTGTTNFPEIYINTTGATAPTTLSTGGTFIGGNSASGFTGNWLDFHVNGGGSNFLVGYTGNVYANNSITTAGALVSQWAPSASAQALSLTGAPYAGGTSTTNFPLAYFNTSGATAVTTFGSGTFIGVNAASAFSGNFLDFHLNGSASLFSVNSKGNLILSSTSVPTMAAGAAAGTSPTCTTVTGNNNSMTLTCTTGTSPTTGTLATITFSGTLSSAPQACTLTARTATTAPAATSVYATAPTTTSWTIGVATALTASTTYTWGAHCL